MKTTQIKAVLENSSDQPEEHLIGAIKHILGLSWISVDNLPREGEDLILKVNGDIRTGYYMDERFCFDFGFIGDNSMEVTHYIYSKELL